MNFSPRNAETLQLSPAHSTAMSSLQGDLKTLRRSMSRSPSKKARTRNPLGEPLQSSSTSSPVSRKLNANDTPNGSNTWLTRKLRPTSSTRPSAFNGGTFTSPRTESPKAKATRRPLSVASDFGNSSSQSSQDNGEGQENQAATPDGSPPDPHVFTLLRPRPQTTSFRLASGRPKSIASTECDSLKEWLPAKSSPLKRSDGLMNLDQPSFGSPAKRRSLHGATFEIARDGNSPTPPNPPSDGDTTPEDTPVRSSLAPRFNISNRKPHPSHRLSERMAMSKHRRSLDLDATPVRRANSRGKSRVSLDSDSISQNFDSDVTSSLGTEHKQVTRHQPHPLSQALSPTSSMPSSTDQNNNTTHDSIFSTDTRPDFSRSLPIGALRPNQVPKPSPSSGSSLSSTSYATPKPFTAAKPDPAAFLSTGLISKKHRNPDEMPPPPGGHGTMPDTPCKKASIGFGFKPSPPSVNSVVKPRFAQPLFGTPTKPVTSVVRSLADSASGTKSSLKSGSEETSLNRSASFISNEDSDSGRSPKGSHGQCESQSSADELPPTPTKQVFGFAGTKTNYKSSSLRSSLLNRRTSVGPQTFIPPSTNETPFQSQTPVASFVPNSRSPPLSTPLPNSAADAGFPDPSQLSISPHDKVVRTPTWRNHSRSDNSPPPETPSASGPNGKTFALAGPLTTPNHRATSAYDVDASLSKRFQKVEWYSRGQFSDVYKVHANSHPQDGSYFSSFARGDVRTRTTEPASSLFIVKRSKALYTSSEIRQRIVREITIMQSLGHNDHVVQLIDSWEADHHLYLQLEFCEEGSLDGFLARQGLVSRLDDFRIWKILLEVGAGIKFIHDSGFLHLDIKPENIFIVFSGALKVGDFGLASEWPAPRSIEGEGDRRYIGPDLLMGYFDKPADVFAFGMMMYEIAANCVPPDNGANWQKLRSGDFSGLPSLTCSSDQSLSTGTSATLATDSSIGTSDESSSFITTCSSKPGWVQTTSSIDSHVHELSTPPSFMIDSNDPNSLDNVIHGMMRPQAEDRPTIEQLLNLGPCIWVAVRRRHGAVVWEGKWGPDPSMLVSEWEQGGFSGKERVKSRNTRHAVDQSTLGTFFDDADIEMMDV